MMAAFCFQISLIGLTMDQAVEGNRRVNLPPLALSFCRQAA